MIEIFKLGGLSVTREDLLKVLHNPQKTSANASNNKSRNDLSVDKDVKACSNYMLESFLNGFIIFKRGHQDGESTQSKKNDYLIKKKENRENPILENLKKV